VKAEREAWFELQPEFDPSKLVFVDETGATTKMARLRGRSPRGERCRAAVPHGHWKTTTLVAGLRLDGLSAPMLIDGAMDGAAFAAWVERLRAEPRPGRYRRSRQSARPQGDGGPGGDRTGWRDAALPASLQPRLQSDRAGLRQAEGAPAARRPPAHSTLSRTPSPRRSTPSIPPSAPITLPTQATSQIDPKML
jgi:DDE superfamily endonuclease